MSVTITYTHITSTVLDDQAVRCHDGTWTLSGPILGPPVVVDRVRAIAALTVMDAIKTIHPAQPCDHCLTWLMGLRHLLTPDHTAEPTSTVHCLYCGSTNDIYETRITVDERTDEYALTCGDCGGVWAA